MNNVYRSIDSSWDHTDVIFLEEGNDLVPLRIENAKNKYTVYVAEKTIEERKVFQTLKNTDFVGKIKVQLPDTPEIYYGWFQNHCLHRDDGPAFVKIDGKQVLSAQWLMNGVFNDQVNNHLVGLDRMGESIKFFYRFGTEKFHVIRSNRSGSSTGDAPESLQNIVNDHYNIVFSSWDSLLNTYNPELYD